jgi:hypothetical protein
MASSAVRFPVDDASAFRATADATGAIAATVVTSDEIALDVLSAYWDNDDVANAQEIAIFGRVTDVVDGGGSIAVQSSATGAFGDTVTLATKTITAEGSFTFVIAREQLAGATAIRLQGLSANGTSGIDFWAYAAPVIGG